MSKKIAIIGMGAAAIYAAKAARDSGVQVEIFSYGGSFRTPVGAFWLHDIPESLKDKFAPVNIWQTGKGTAEAYIKLQWGDRARGVKESSFPRKGAFTLGYNPDDVLPVLLPMDAEVQLLAGPLSDTDIADLAKLREYDLILQTFPTKESKQEQPRLIPFVTAGMHDPEDGRKNFLLYNGTGEGIVVREAHLFGNHYLEFPKFVTRAEIQRTCGDTLAGYILSDNLDMDPATKPWSKTSHSKIKLIGRWAEWNQKRLTHEIYSIVCGMLK